jgi:hypothetical protein
MRTKWVIVWIGWLLLTMSSLRAQGEAGDLLGRINNLRASKGLAAYNLNGALAAAAQNHAQWMVETGSVTHIRPDGSSPQSRAAAAGYASQWVSENIYGGSRATVNDAWRFWLNSSIHYAGLINVNYQEIGIGIARGSWGAAFVLVFGNNGQPYEAPQAQGSGGRQPKKAPSFVVGQDEHGNIKHQVQPGDTLGQIALIYGYTWNDIPAMLQLNNLVAEDGRNLKIGSIFLVPPKAGTYTPSPGDPAEAATVPSDPTQPAQAAQPASATASSTDAPPPTPTPQAIVTVAYVPANVALAPTMTATTPFIAEVTPLRAVQGSITIEAGGESPWLAVALVVQAGVLLAAGFEFIRRSRRR